MSACTVFVAPEPAVSWRSFPLLDQARIRSLLKQLASVGMCTFDPPPAFAWARVADREEERWDSEGGGNHR